MLKSLTYKLYKQELYFQIFYFLSKIYKTVLYKYLVHFPAIDPMVLFIQLAVNNEGVRLKKGVRLSFNLNCLH